MAMEFVRCSLCCKAQYGCSQEKTTISPQLCSPWPAKVFQYCRRLVQISSSCLRGLFYQTIFDHRSGVNFHLLRYALAPPIYPPPPSPLGVRNNASLAGYISLGPRQAMKISGTGEGLAIERGRVAKYLRFIYFFQIEQKKT